MIVTRLQLRDFRSYERGELRLGPGLTVVAAQNGAGKTNLLEALEGADVVLKLISPLRPGLIAAADGSGFQYLLMPIRLNV